MQDITYKRLTAAQLKTVLSYNPQTGLFHRLTVDGKQGRCLNTSGRKHELYLRVSGFTIKATIAAWCYMTGCFPPLGKKVISINGNKDDLRFSNLALQSHSRSSVGRKYRGDAKTPPGVIYEPITRCGNKRPLPWRAKVKVNGKPHYLGYFRSAEMASDAYQAAVKEIHDCGQLTIKLTKEIKVIKVI